MSLKYIFLLIHEVYANISFMSLLESMANGDVTFRDSMDGIAEDV